MNILQCDCLVIGAGAAGMMAAITAARKSAGTGKKVIIVEHTEKIGNKILQTGNGKCNFTNLDMDEGKYQNEDKSFVKEALSQFGVYNTINFFKGIGVYHKEKNGYVYPNSETAASLQNALRLEVEHQKIKVILKFNIRNCRISRDKKFYEVISDKSLDTMIKAKSLIIATGSMAAPKTGSDGSGYELAKQLGHTAVKPLPALVQLISDDKVCKMMAGVRSTGKVVLYVDNKECAWDYGEIQYTDYGISGIPVFQISRFAVKAADSKKKVYAAIDMLTQYSLEELEKDTKIRLGNENYKTIEEFFCGLLNKKLVSAIARKANVGINDKVKAVNYKKIMDMLKLMKDFRVNITGFKPFENAQICQGGISLKEINCETMESKLHKGLYFAGEVMDVDGKCGGYNLQWAWSSGYIAGKNAVSAGNEVVNNKHVKNQSDKVKPKTFKKRNGQGCI